MTVAAVVLVPRAPVTRDVGEAVEAALRSGADEVVVVVSSAKAAEGLPEGVSVLLDDAAAPDEASAARVAADWSARSGHGALVVHVAGGGRGAGRAPGPRAGARAAAVRTPAASRATAWAALVSAAPREPVLIGTVRGAPAGIVRLEATIWSGLPLSGSLDVLWRARPEVAAEVALDDVA